MPISATWSSASAHARPAYTPSLTRLLLHAYSCTPSLTRLLCTPTLTRLLLHAYSCTRLLLHAYCESSCSTCVPCTPGAQFTCFTSTRVQILTPEGESAQYLHFCTSKASKLSTATSPLARALPRVSGSTFLPVKQVNWLHLPMLLVQFRAIVWGGV